MKSLKKITILFAILSCIALSSCKENTAKNKEELRKDMLDKTTSMNVVLWMRKQPNIVNLYKNQKAREGFTTNAKFKERIATYQKCEIEDIKLMDYEEVGTTQEWTYRIIKFMGDNTKVYVGKAGFDGKAFKPGETIVDWVSTSQLDV